MATKILEIVYVTHISFLLDTADLKSIAVWPHRIVFFEEREPTFCVLGSVSHWLVPLFPLYFMKA